MPQQKPVQVTATSFAFYRTDLQEMITELQACLDFAKREGYKKVYVNMEANSGLDLIVYGKH